MDRVVFKDGRYISHLFITYMPNLEMFKSQTRGMLFSDEYIDLLLKEHNLGVLRRGLFNERWAGGPT